MDGVLLAPGWNNAAAVDPSPAIVDNGDALLVCVTDVGNCAPDMIDACLLNTSNGCITLACAWACFCPPSTPSAFVSANPKDCSCAACAA